VSQTASQPERVVHMVEDVAKTTASPGGGAYATKLWKDKAVKVDIIGYVTNMELKNIELVSRFVSSFTCKSQRLIIKCTEVVVI